MTNQPGSSIAPECVQEVLDSAPNAADKGQSAFYTPREFAVECARLLPDHRPVITDLNAGRGALLFSAANSTTRHLLALDIDPCRSEKDEGDKLSLTRWTIDLTLAYPLTEESGWRFDLGVFNPPFDLHWFRDRLAKLADSALDSVRLAFAGRDPRLGADTIDSTVATLLIALDRMTTRGEGYMIANNATLERLIFAENAPHRQVSQHIWAHITIDGNPMTGIKGNAWQDDFKIGVIWFARDQQLGPQYRAHTANMEEFRTAIARANRRSNHMARFVMGDYHVDNDCHPLWLALRNEWKARQGEKLDSGYNIWLAPDGTISTNLSLYERKLIENGRGKVDKRAAERLHALNGQRPMQLVVQTAQRQELANAVHGGVWRVHPDLPRMVDECIAQYHAVRAPLYPLSKMQSLGYVEEENAIRCLADVTLEGKVIFSAGSVYPLRTQTVKIERTKMKPNLTGGEDEFLMNGQELAIYIGDEDATERCFMEKRHSGHARTDNYHRNPVAMDFDLHALIEHFEVRPPPDVATTNPAGYEQNLKKIEEIERRMNHA